VEQWKLARDGHQCVAILSTDMTKAFDSLHPPLMLNKLRAYGFAENTVNLPRSYLSHRINRIRQVVHRGCPQGSALGQLLWNIFQNYQAYEINLNFSMYADDHKIYEVKEGISQTSSHHLAGMQKKHLNDMKTTCSRVTIVNTKPWKCRTKEK